MASMRYLLPLLLCALLLAACSSPNPARHPGVGAANPMDSTLTAMDPVPAGWAPEAFLDSVGHLPLAPLVVRATDYADSVFTHQPMLSRVFSEADIRRLKRAGQTGFMAVSAARRILCDTTISVSSNSVGDDSASALGLVHVRHQSFGADAYGLEVGIPGHHGAAMYFFKGRRLLARHETLYRDYSLAHYQDVEGRLVVYYIYSFMSGSGNWWNQYFFYRYEGERLVPVLTELQNGNQTGFGSTGAREYWLEASVVQTRPLTLKMVYHVAMPDRAGTIPNLLDDSTLVVYGWNQRTGRLEGQYERAKLSYPQVLSFNTEQVNNWLFINTYYAQLKRALTDEIQRPATRRYLWSVRQSGSPLVR